MTSRAQAGFSWVELIVVIVVLGILAAMAVPRFLAPGNDARVAAVKNLGGALKSAALMAHDVCLAQSCANEQTLVIHGQRVTFVNGYPNAATVGRLLEHVEGFTANDTGNRFTRNRASTAHCWVQYDDATVSGGVVSPPTISYQSGTITDRATEQSVNAALSSQC